MNAWFLPRRLGLTLRADLLDTLRRTLLASAAIGGAVLLLSLLGREWANADANPYRFWFGAMLILWGVDVTSRAFADMYDRTRNEAFLLRPASALEKTLSRLALTTLLFIGYLLVFTWAVSALTETVRLLVFGHARSLFVPWDPAVWTLIAHYIPLQALFFVGAAVFRRHPFIKTVLALVLLVIGLLAVLWLLVRVLGPFGFDGVPAWVRSDDIDLQGVAQQQHRIMHAAAAVAQFVWFAVLPPFCWAVAWLRVREVQVSDGV